MPPYLQNPCIHVTHVNPIHPCTDSIGTSIVDPTGAVCTPGVGEERGSTHQSFRVLVLGLIGL